MDYHDSQWEQEGKEEKAIETAKNLLEMGIEIDKIAKATGLILKFPW